MDKRDFKTSPQQWKVIVDFGEEHPSIFRPQFKNGDGDARQHAELWEELATRLNCMGFGVRNADKWKMAVGRWKSKVKAKAAQIDINARKTGVGPIDTVPLSDIEERLMNLISWKAVTGDGNPELGMRPLRPIVAEQPLPQLLPLSSSRPPSTITSSNIPPSPKLQLSIAISPPLPLSGSRPPSTINSENIPPSPELQHSIVISQPEEPTHPSKSPPRPLPTTPARELSRKRSRLSTETSRKFVTLTRIDQEAMEERKKLRETIQRQAETQEAMIQVFKDFVDYYKNKHN